MNINDDTTVDIFKRKDSIDSKVVSTESSKIIPETRTIQKDQTDNNDHEKEFIEAKMQVKKIALFRLNELFEIN